MQRSIALVAERLGFEGFYRSDHLTSTAGRFERESNEAWMTLAGLARETSRIRLGTLVSPIGFRHPSYYAKLVSTVDVMSNGRVTASIGTGWYAPEHKLLGFPFPPLAERFDRLEEYLEVLMAAWSETPKGFSGRWYSLGAVELPPRSPQHPHPHLIIGGHGKTWTPRLAARFADEFNIDWKSPETCRVLYDLAEEHCEALGRDPTTLHKSVLLGAVVGRDAADAERRYNTAARFLGISDPATWRSEHAEGWTVGPVASLVERLARYEAVGVDHVILMLAPGDDEGMMALVAEACL